MLCGGTHTGRSITRREAEARETWKSMDEEKQAEFREGPWSDWPFGVRELIRTSGPIVQVCATHML